MELVEVHEHVMEDRLISKDSLWHTVVLFCPQPKRAKSFRYLQCCQGRSPKQVCCAINDEQYEVLTHAKLDFCVINKIKSPNDDAQRPAILARGGEDTDVLHPPYRI